MNNGVFNNVSDESIQQHLNAFYPALKNSSTNQDTSNLQEKCQLSQVQTQQKVETHQEDNCDANSALPKQGTTYYVYNIIC